MTRSRILVIGSSGQLGHDLVQVLNRDYDIQPADSRDFDITDLEATGKYITELKPDYIIHSAAYTDVDGCEDNRDKAYQVNSLGSRNVAIASREANATLFNISTDYVFSGEKEGPYFEYDAPNPQTVYGRSKLWGEKFVREQTPKHFIIRIAWLYGAHGDNFLKTMLELGDEKDELQVVNDQIGSPTWTVEVVKQINVLLQTKAYGTYHVTSSGGCSWYEFAKEIFTITKKEVNLIPVSSDEFPRPAPRPKNSLLKNYVLQLQGSDRMPHWKESLETFLRQYDKEANT